MRIKIKTVGLLRNEGWEFDDTGYLCKEGVGVSLLPTMQKECGLEFESTLTQQGAYHAPSGFAFPEEAVIILD